MVIEDKFSSSARGKRFLPFNSKKEKEWQGNFTFIQAADTQFGMQESYVEKKEVVGWQQEVKWSQQMVNQVNEMSPRPRFMVICGDLLDAWPQTQSQMRDEQEKDFKNVFQNLKVPLVCVCGNHDIGNQPSMKSVNRYRSSFGDDFYSFWCGGVYFLVLNSQYHEDSSQVPKLAAEQEIWFEQQLKKIKKTRPTHAVIFQHIPLFLNHPDEEKEYFNYAPGLRHQMLERIYEAGVRHVFSGHYHRNAGGMYKDLQMVITSAVGAQLGSDQQGYRIVNVTKESLNHEYQHLIPTTSIPLMIPSKIIKNLLEMFRKNNKFDDDKYPAALIKPLRRSLIKAVK